VTPKRAEVFLPKERLVSHLRHDVTRFYATFSATC